ncbi:hypothetical protein Z517_08582 [Fonsecaea pedrosoi CBS 271.37]|uniref:NACHT domain-containing protein n=1 Tax=Fonsecaea pedrosoi CBS 271.37 TaxID=1442368 RepID=A0A0D2GDB2_9EURO|nr:uncharacterized protein Z517_08582 [Fonsecaea pedrosoi CBS 271.37]KIW78743.1 hypothetical protein Z517_08582 [Fonsecaea pedrosoi CBS 271.37]
MDPITAVSIAGNAIQFVDFTAKLISKGAELYKYNTLSEHVELRKAAVQLRSFQLPHKLDDLRSLQTTSLTEDQSLLLSQLEEAYSYCTDCAEQIIEAVGKLTVSGDHRKWKSFRHALSSVMGVSKLDDASRRLSNARQQLMLFLLLYNERERGTRELKELQAGSAASILTELQGLKDELHSYLSSLRHQLVAQDQSLRGPILTSWIHQHEPTMALAEEKVAEVLQEQTRLRFCSHLRFHQIDDRYGSIAQAHEKTFEWVLHPDSQRDASWDNFAQWLEEPQPLHNIYWQSGKPGSGKSVLMKYLSTSPTTFQLLSKWQSQKHLLVAKCFFWNPGTELQKSLQGMLRTLLFQILIDKRVDCAVIEYIAPWRWYACQSSNFVPEAWSVPELSAMFESTVQRIAEFANVVFFVDGLDEFGRDNVERQELVRLFLSLRGLETVKICVSSRPWNVFIDAFEGFPCLRLEDLTRGDILAFVEAECQESKAFRDLEAVDPKQVLHIREEIVTKSSGVFLWVYLVTKRLLAEMQDGLRSPKKLLEEIPEGLDEYFQFMLSAISTRDQARVSRILQLMKAIRSSTLPSLMILSFTDEESADFALQEGSDHESLDAIRARVLSMRRLFQSQCMDLLEYKEIPQDDYPWQNSAVDYLHRTVEEFLASPATQNLLNNYTNGAFDTSWYLVNAHLKHIVFIDAFITSHRLPTRQGAGKIIHHFDEFALKMNRVKGRPCSSVARCFDKAAVMVCAMLETNQSPHRDSGFILPAHGDLSVSLLGDFHRVQSHVEDPHLYLAVLYRASAYVEAKLSINENLLSPKFYVEAMLFNTSAMTDMPDASVLLLLLKRCRCFADASEAVYLSHSYWQTIKSGVSNFGNNKVYIDYAEVTKAILELTKGLELTSDQSSDLARTMLNVFGYDTLPLAGRKDVQKHLHNVQKTWRVTTPKWPEALGFHKLGQRMRRLISP